MRIAGVNLPINKHIEIALTSIYGVGRSRAQKICNAVGVGYSTLTKNLTSAEEEAIRKEVGQYEIEGDLRRLVSMNIKRLIDLKCFRGLRHFRGLPVRGQRTHTNARTRKGHKKGGQTTKKGGDKRK